MLTQTIYIEENEAFPKFNSLLKSTFLYILVAAMNYLLYFSLFTLKKKSLYIGRTTLNAASIIIINLLLYNSF